MNVFVLSTGRSGTTTFVRACGHIENYSAGHETRCSQLGDERLAYPENHIEADNRLSWFLGRLDEVYGTEAFYVHLVRDLEPTARSFDKRWDLSPSIIRAYSQDILMRGTEELEVCRDYWRTVNANIRLFLQDKPNQLRVDLEDAQEGFRRFWQEIEAEGDLEAALAEWETRHNASEGPSRSFLDRLLDRLPG